MIREAIKIELGIGPYHSSMGLALQGLGRLDEAIGWFQSATKISPRLPQHHNNLGLALMDRGAVDKAEACLRSALSIDSGIL